MRLPTNSLAERQRRLIESLRYRGITSDAVLHAMGRVPREQFVPSKLRHVAYADRPQPIGHEQTISQPYIVALMTESLELTSNESVLEIGTGSGYQAAVLGELARSVLTIERFGELARRADKRLSQLGYRNVTVIEGDGNLGWPAQAPYDRVIVTAATARCPPELFEQLREDGLLVIPLGCRDSQVLTKIRKVHGEPISGELCRCAFVPLVHGEVDAKGRRVVQ
ncbi:MAG TPA: protein-L-isoaspartate(D-aspartate) O-methyltransferase [Pirellulales bacterium]|nr:protein-L-isoaspartate(D-aspartate) O-methyltransferase [Pirellulales bacterium]